MDDQPDEPPEQDSRLVRGPFLRGPILLAWLTACDDMSGKTIMVALAIVGRPS